MSKALLLGATGLVGSFCLEFLLKSEYFSSVEIWVRNSTGITHPKLIEKIINFDAITSFNKTDASHVFCCLGTTIKAAGSQAEFCKVDFTYVTELAKLAECSGCLFFSMVSSIGANKLSSIFYLKTKGEAEYFISNCNISSIYILRPSFLIGKRKKIRLAESVGGFFIKIFGVFLVGKLKKYKGINASDVAGAMVFFSQHCKNGINIIESDKINQHSR